MKRVRSLMGILLVLVMLGSVVSPALAVNVEQKTLACPSFLTVPLFVTNSSVFSLGFSNKILAIK